MVAVKRPYVAFINLLEFVLSIFICCVECILLAFICISRPQSMCDLSLLCRSQFVWFVLKDKFL